MATVFMTQLTTSQLNSESSVGRQNLNNKAEEYPLSDAQSAISLMLEKQEKKGARAA